MHFFQNESDPRVGPEGEAGTWPQVLLLPNLLLARFSQLKIRVSADTFPDFFLETAATLHSGDPAPPAPTPTPVPERGPPIRRATALLASTWWQSGSLVLEEAWV